jgi:hypothetical protein
MPQTRKTRRAGGATGSGNAVCLAANSPQNSRIERSPQAQSRFRASDFETVNRAAIAALPAILARLVPGGKRIGGEYVVLNPIRADRRLGSFKINVRTGRWADFATGDKGGDPVSLVAYLEGCSQGEAARRLGRMLGLDTREGRRHGRIR